MIEEMVNIRDFELMVSETEMSKAGKGQMNIEIHWALADELITRLREAEKDAVRYRWLRNCTTIESKEFVSKSGGWIVGLGVLDGMIDQAMKEKGDE